MAVYEGSHINFEKVTIGKNVYIGKGCTIGFAPEHKDLDPMKPETWGRVRIADNARIYNNVNIDASMDTNGETVIGEGSIVMAQSHIGHDCKIGKECRISSGSILGGHTQIGDFANIGINATTHQYTKIGEGVMLGAGCFAKGELKPFTIYHTGLRAKEQGVNTVLLERMGQKQGKEYNY